MEPLEVKILLLKAGVTQAAIAQSLGISRSAVSHEVNGRMYSARIRKAIARAVKRKTKDLWPGMS